MLKTNACFAVNTFSETILKVYHRYLS